MGQNNINYVQIRKRDANGAEINLNLQDSIGTTLTFTENTTNTSRWTIQTLQEFQTYYLLGVVEMNDLYTGQLNPTFNELIPGITQNVSDTLQGGLGLEINVTAVTGEGSGATVRVGNSSNNNPGGAACDMIKVVNQGQHYKIGDQVKIISGSDQTPAREILITLTEEMLTDATSEILNITNAPFYNSFSFEEQTINYLGPSPPDGGDLTIADYDTGDGSTIPVPGGAIYTPIFFKPQFNNNTLGNGVNAGTNPQPIDSIQAFTPKGPLVVYTGSTYQFGMMPQAPLQFTLKIVNISSSHEGHFYFNMFQKSDKTGTENVFSGRVDTDTGAVVNNFRGFGLSSSYNSSFGQTLTGPVKITTSTIGSIILSGSIAAKEIQSGSSMIIGVSKDPNDFSSNNPSLHWEQMTWSLDYDPSASYFTGSFAQLTADVGGQYPGTSSWTGFDWATNQTLGPTAFINPYTQLWDIWAVSDYNPILGNEQIQRPNSFLMSVEYNSQTGSMVPSNRFQILSGSAAPARLPDSNYTQRRVIHPRYLGCRLQSADYNFYTEPGFLGEGDNFNFGLPIFTSQVSQSETEAANNPVLDQFLNGDTCSIAPQYAFPTSSNSTASKQWYGDLSYGKTAVIDRYPKYIAHFQNSHDSFLKFGTRQFDLDALIEIPNEDITGEQGFQAIPIPLDGDGEYQFDVAKTFEAGRDTGIFFNTYVTGGINYALLPGRKRRRKRPGKRRLSPKSGEIYDGGMKYTLLYTNEVGGAPESADLEDIAFAPSYSFAKRRSKIKLQQVNTTVYNDAALPAGQENAFTHSIQMVTGSSEYGIDENFFILSGSTLPMSGSGGGTIQDKFSSVVPFSRLPRKRRFFSGIFPKLVNDLFYNFYALGGPQLAVMHTHNYYLYKNIKAQGIGVTQYGRRRNLAFNPGVSAKRKSNFYKFLPRNSGAPGYEYDREPFLLEPGDEIRVTAEVATAGYEKHTGSLSTGVDPFSATFGSTYGYMLDSEVRARNAGWNAQGGSGVGPSYNNMSTTTDGEGTGAKLRVDICEGTLLPMQYTTMGWLGSICDGYFKKGVDYQNDVTNAGSGLTGAITYTDVAAQGGSGTEATFDVTVGGGVVTAVVSKIPGRNYKNGDTITFLVSQIGTTGTSPTITVGNKIGVGNKPSTKMAFYDPQINPSSTTGAGSLDNLQLSLTFTGENGFNDASCTDIKLYRVGTGYADGDYIIFDSHRLRMYGAGTGEAINAGLSGVTGSALQYDDLVLRIPKTATDGYGGTINGPCNHFVMQGGTGYRAGDMLYIPKANLSASAAGTWYSGEVLGDVQYQIKPTDLDFKDTSTTTRDFSFQVLAVSQSNFWSGSKVTTDTGVYQAYPGYANNFGWCGLETGSALIEPGSTNFTPIDLVPFIISPDPLPTNNTTQVGVSTTSVDAPNGTGGSGLTVDITTLDGIVSGLKVNDGGSGYSFDEIVEINCTGDNLFLQIPMQAIQRYDCSTTGSVSLVGQFGAPANKIFVHPNPIETLYGIDSGEITRCTFRKRKPTDQSVVVEMDAPSGSLGAKTPSGDGFLIPSDLSLTQKKNALSVINKLNAQNAFRKNRN